MGMRTSRLEAFSDGVLAIIITIMVLELKIPEGHHFQDLVHETGNGLLTYLLSFAYVGLYWNNHHHMFHLVERIDGTVLWANLGLLFALSLFPFTTAWVDESMFAQTPVVVYGVNLLGAAVAYWALQTLVIRRQGPDCALREAVGNDHKGKISPVVLLIGILAASIISRPWGTGTALACYAGVALMWIVPDRRVARFISRIDAQH
jgi:uncharacterized membrane protein